MIKILFIALLIFLSACVPNGGGEGPESDPKGGQQNSGEPENSGPENPEPEDPEPENPEPENPEPENPPSDKEQMILDQSSFGASILA